MVRGLVVFGTFSGAVQQGTVEMSPALFPVRKVTIDGGRDPVGPEHVTKVIRHGYAVVVLSDKHVIGPHVLYLPVVGEHLMDAVFVKVVAIDDFGIGFLVALVKVFTEHIV